MQTVRYLPLLALIACGRSGSETTGSAAVGSGSAAGAPVGTPVPEGPKRLHGTVTFFELRPNCGSCTASFSVVAAFFAPSYSSAPCERGTALGDCCYVPPMPPREPGAPAATGAYVAPPAGQLTITNGTSPLVAMAPTSNNTYEAIDQRKQPGLAWKPGDALTVAAAGDAAGIPAFSGSVRAVGVFTTITPDVAQKRALGTSDFTITWQPDTLPDEDVTLHINALGARNEGHIQCKVADRKGTLTVPGAFLAKFTHDAKAWVQLARSAVTKPTLDHASVEIVSTTTILVGAGSTF
jgi:hypothetical protein